MAEPMDVSAVLARSRKKFKTAAVDKEDDLEYDLGNLHAFDSHPIDALAFTKGKEEYLQALGRDNTQLLFGRIFSLPTKRVPSGVIATLPTPSYRLPREKPVPKPKPLTKWERFAKAKGIQKRKKERMVWDEDFQEWRPRFGYKRANNPLDKDNWIVELKEGDDPDAFAKLARDKKERVKKQRKATLANRAKAAKTKMKPIARAMHTDVEVTTAKGVVREKGGEDGPRKDRKKRRTELSADLIMTQAATASHGLFQEKLKGDKEVKRKIKTKKSGPTEDLSGERQVTMKVIDRLLRKKEGTLDVDRAVKAHNRAVTHGGKKRS
eukprot:TRINITY_DN9676_c0_g1_i1.p1 TRINITY_DN9676_c0_g1~~TRINITY_DN9676_c0_g1_i1.p1  ORF type:complete len:335 (-),score=141.21 TRINITY_DN9676_c0_g1_i1:49-1017(-)